MSKFEGPGSNQEFKILTVQLFLWVVSKYQRTVGQNKEPLVIISYPNLLHLAQIPQEFVLRIYDYDESEPKWYPPSLLPARLCKIIIMVLASNFDSGLYPIVSLAIFQCYKYKIVLVELPIFYKIYPYVLYRINFNTLEIFPDQSLLSCCMLLSYQGYLFLIHMGSFPFVPCYRSSVYQTFMSVWYN